MNNEFKQNDMLLATLANPGAKPHDFLNNDLNPENTQLLDKDFYKSKRVIKEQFTLPDGKFDEQGFNNAYNLALNNYNLISNEESLKELEKVEYDPFDAMRPVGSQVYSVDVKFSKDYNPFKQVYSRSSINSIDKSKLSLKEIAQQGKIYDIDTDTWSESVNRIGLFDKLFGDTLVYAQWEDEGIHIDPINGSAVKHKKGDWKLDPDGKLFLEKLGDREIYGKQVVSISDILTTDGSAINKAIDFMDSDGREKSIGKIAAKTVAEIAPLLIPGFGTKYAAVRASMGLAAVMPTVIKSIDSFIRGDSADYGRDPITKAEGWMSKFSQQSISEAGTGSFWNVEQMSSMVSDIFTQLYEQRAMASLSKILMRPDKLMNNKKNQLMVTAAEYASRNGVSPNRAIQMVLEQSPDLKKMYDIQSKLSKSLSLGYMALTSTGDIYGEAVNSGYDRKTAGFAALMAAAGQYGIMMNNPMSDWFLDSTTGYHVNMSRAASKKAITPYFDEMQAIFKDISSSPAIKRNKLADLSLRVRKSMSDWLSSGGTSSIYKNMLTEGMEEVTEQAVLDATKGVVEVMDYLGLTKGKGTFRTIERFTTGEAFQEYLANFVGGMLGGGLFEIERTKITPWIENRGKLSPEVYKSLAELVAAGHKDELIKAVKREAKYLGNNTLSYLQDEETDLYKPAEAVSQAQIIADKTIEIIEELDTLLNSEGLVLTDEDIIKKAIRTELVLQGLEKSKVEGKHYGIEGLVIDDIRNASVEIAKIKAEIKSLEGKDGAEEQIKVEKEKLKSYKDTVNSILSGEQSMNYFDQIINYLDPDIRQIFGSLDKNNYIKAKYKKDYIDLPEDGLGLTRKSADIEWDEFLSSTDIRKKLKVITDSYKELEKTLNPTIADYVDSGYYDVRKEVQNNVIDLEKTIQLFNTATSPAEKSAALNNFIAINKNLESLGIVKILPYDAYVSNIAEDLFDNKLVKKRTVDPDGNIKLEDFSEEELSEVKNGKSLKSRIAEAFNNIARNFPLNPINLENIIYNSNASIEQYNLNIQNRIEAIKSSDPNGERAEEIKLLTDSIIPFAVIGFEDTSTFKNLQENYNNKLKSILNNIGISGDNFLDDGNKLINKYITLQNMKDSFSDGSFDNIVKKINPNVNNVSELTNAEKLSLIEYLDQKNLLQETLISNINIPNLENNLKQLLTDLSENRETNSEFEDLFFKAVNNTIDQDIAIINNPLYEDVVKELSDARAEYNIELETNKPEIFKIRNLAFDVLLDALEKGYEDKELYLLARNMFEQESNSLLKIIFPGLNNINSDLIKSISDNTLDMGELSIDILTAYELEFTPQDTVQTLVNERDILDNDKLLNFLVDHFDPDTTLGTIHTSIINAKRLIEENKSKIDNIARFFSIKQEGLKTNPIYDRLREFSMTMNSNPRSAINKILDILEREELSYKASSGVSTYTADDIRNKDIQQAINMLDMFDTVINKMSTTSFDGEGITGFIAMRQQFAKKIGAKDDVLNLKTINSDQAAVMSRDIKTIRTRLQFLKDLSDMNARKIANEYEEVRNQMDLVMVDVWKSMLDIPELTPFMPADIIDILNSKDENELKLIKAETSFYDHNKNSKKEALDALLSVLNKFDYDDVTSYTSDTTFISDYNKAIYFATILQLRSEDYVKRNILSLEGKLNKAPFYSQELATKIIIAHTQNPELFSEIFRVKQSALVNDVNFLTFLLGGSGAGKTTVGVGQVLDIFRQTNEKSNVWLASPSEDQALKLTDDVKNSITDENLSISTLSKSKLFSMFGEGIKKIYDKIMNDVKNIDNTTKEDYVYITENWSIGFNLDESWESLIEYDKLPNILVIDEVTHFSKAELQLLDFISKKSYANNKSNFMKVVGVGDKNQRGFKIYSPKNKQYVDYSTDSLAAVFTPPLNLSVRASNDQKRSNTDMLLGLMNRADELYFKAEKEAELSGTIPNYKELNQKLSEFLKDVRNNLGLKYYKSDDTLEGDLIIKDYKELTPFKSIKKSIENNPKLTIGILTENGRINEELLDTLTNAGFTKDDIDNIKIFVPANVQGNEVDYFIFDSSIIENFDKLIDTLRSFYTYTTRSKIGSIIIDKKNDLYNKLNIENAAPSTYPVVYDPLTPEVIKELKDKRVSKLKKFVNDNMDISEESYFKWKVGEEEEVKDRFDKEILELPSISPDPSENKFIHTKIDTEKTVYPQTTGFTQDDFGIMFHSFYNNPNAKVSVDEQGNYVSITVDRSRINSDLNGIDNVTDPKKVQTILTEWGRLRSELLHNDVKVKSSTSYKNFFNHIFGNEIGNVEINLVRTASIFDKEVNTPLKKFGYIESELINDKEPFLNIMAELKLNGKVHYITLATMAKLSTIKEKGLANLKVDKGDPEKVRQDIANELESKLNKLYDSLLVIQNQGKQPFVILDKLPFTKDNKKIINLITSTRLEDNNKQKHYLINLDRDFIGLYHSEIRIFPNTYDAFKNLINRYTFGEVRTDDKIKSQFNLFKGKPYIVVSYNNDINGSSNNKTSAKLIPINTEGRPLDVLIQEVSKIKEDLNQEISDYFGKAVGEDYNKLKRSYRVSNEINVKTETLLDRSQILDILIEWGKTPYEDGTLLDLLTKEIEVSAVDGSPLKRKISLLHIVDNFKKADDDTLSENGKKLLDVITAVKQNINSPTIKKDVINAISKWTGWSWSFHNIFALYDAIEKQKDRDFNRVLQGFMIDDSQLVDTKNYEIFEKYGEALINKLREDPKRLFYYSIPIVADGERNIKVNPLVSGELGFSSDFLGNKIYINQTPEAERGIIPLGIYRDMDIKDNVTITNNSPVIEQEPELVPEESVPKITSDEYSITSVFKDSIPAFVTLLNNLGSDTVEKWDEELSKIDPKFGIRNKTVKEIFTELATNIAIKNDVIDMITITESGELEDSEDLLLLLNITEANDKLETLANQVIEQYKQCK